MRFIPVDLGAADFTFREADFRDPLELAPATLTISFAQLLPISELTSGRDHLDRGHLSDDLESHVQESYRPVVD